MDARAPFLSASVRSCQNNLWAKAQAAILRAAGTAGRLYLSASRQEIENHWRKDSEQAPDISADDFGLLENKEREQA